MKFSIVITTYNRLSWLQRAVESALNQSLPCEVIVVDDASTDGTQDYLKSLGTQIVHHRNLVNLGHSLTVNTGVNLAQGSWIKLIDDDDYLAPECIEKMTEAIAYYPQAVICSCRAMQINIDGKKIGLSQKYPQNIFLVKQENIHYKMLLDLVSLGTPVQVAFEKQAFLRAGGWEQEFDGNYDDVNAWLKIAQYGDAIFLNDCLAYKMLWTGSQHPTLSIFQRWQTNALIKQKIYSLVPVKYLKDLPPLEVVKNYLKIYWFLVGLKNKKYKDAFQLISQSSLSFKALFLCQKKIFYKYFKSNFFDNELQKKN